MTFRDRLTRYTHHFAGHNGVTLFERDAGVVCIEAPNVVPTRRTVDDLWGFVHALEWSGLDWVWTSERSETPHIGGGDGGPRILTPDSEVALIDDLRASGERGWRSATLVGVDRGSAPAIAKPETFAPALRRFASTERGPVRIVIFQIGDTHDQFLFLPHERSDEVERLLEQLGVHPAGAGRKRAYRPSAGITIESLYRDQ